MVIRYYAIVFIDLIETVNQALQLQAAEAFSEFDSEILY